MEGLPAEKRLRRELSGWPVERGRLDVLRADALVDLAELQATEAPQQALEHVEAALRLAPDHPRGVALRAKLRAR